LELSALVAGSDSEVGAPFGFLLIGILLPISNASALSPSTKESLFFLPKEGLFLEI